MSENCLTLNIWAPVKAKAAPVLLWIHGGALTTGSGRDPVNNGAHLAERSVLVVSINYRLGVFGWLAHPELGAPNIAAMRAMNAAQLNATPPDARSAPFGVVDGHTLPRQLFDTFDRGEHAPVRC